MFSTLLILGVFLIAVSLPSGASQSYATTTRISTVTTQLAVMSTTTSTLGVSQETATQISSATVSGTLPATNGTVGCVYFIHELTGGRSGQNITITSNSVNPIDIYLLSPAAYQSWLNAGRVCTQVNGALLKQLNVSGTASYTVTLPADGSYVILLSNRASNAKAAYTLVISYAQTAVVDVTINSTIIQSSIQSTTLTETFTQALEVQGLLSGQNVLLIVAILVVVIIALVVVGLRKRRGSRSAPARTIRSAFAKHFCTNCGAELRPNVAFCEKCGKPR